MRLWAAFVVHDWGYWGCKTMDGEDGKEHPRLGGRIMGKMFGHEWGEFVTYHSRTTARADGKPMTQLTAADKLAQGCLPKWLYMLLGTMSGEIHEYAGGSGLDEWYWKARDHMVKWAYDHADECLPPPR